MTMQKMLLLIPLRMVNEVPIIRDYLLRGNSSRNNKSKGKEDRSIRFKFSLSFSHCLLSPVQKISFAARVLRHLSCALDA